MPPGQLPNLMDRECNGILLLTRNGIRPPHRITASLVVDGLSAQVKFDVSLYLAKALAPHVDEEAMRLGTAEYRIVRRLMDQEIVSRLVGHQDARNWYDELREFYGWNGRYWDQRALLESELGNFEVARSYAERSIEVHEHPFGYNTLGTVLLRMAISRGNPSILLEGVRNLDKVRRNQDWGEREHPFVAFFTYVHRFADSWGLSLVPEQIRNAWLQWYRDANSSSIFYSPEGHRKLEQWNKNWLELAVV